MSSTSMNRPACPICSTLPVKAPRRAGGYELWRCPRCSLAYHPRPEEQNDDLYEEGYFHGDRAQGIGYGAYEEQGAWDASAMWPQIGSELSGLAIGKGQLLDVGCAYGFFVEQAAMDGWKAVGVDLSEYATEQGRKRGLDLHAGTLEEASFDSNTFDAIICLQTLEHLPDPRSTLRELARVAADGAAIVIDVPNADSIGFRLLKERWKQVKPPEHLQYFGKKSLAWLLSQTGWKPVKTYSLYDPESAIAAANYWGGPMAPVKKLAVRAADISGILSWIRRNGLGTFLRMIARKD